MYGKIRVRDLILWLLRYSMEDVIVVGPGRAGHIEMTLPLRMEPLPTNGEADVAFLKKMGIRA